MMNTAIINPKEAIISLTQQPEPTCPEDGAIIALQACGVCGTDIEKVVGHKPQSQLGHEFVGKIIALGAKQTSPFSIGDRVAVAHHVPCGRCYYCTHYSPSKCPQFIASNYSHGGFSEKIAISAQHLAHTTFKLNDTTPTAHGTLIEPLACALRAIDRYPRQFGINAGVIGLGFMGVLAQQCLQYRGFNTHGVDINPERIKQIETAVQASQLTSTTQQFLETTQQDTQQNGLDLIILSITNEKTIALALDAVRDGGWILLLGGSPSELPLLPQNVLYHREISVLTSYSPSLARLQEAYNIVNNKLLPLGNLLDFAMPLSQVESALALHQSAQHLKIIITANTLAEDIFTASTGAEKSLVERQTLCPQ